MLTLLKSREIHYKHSIPTILGITETSSILYDLPASRPLFALVLFIFPALLPNYLERRLFFLVGYKD